MAEAGHKSPSFADEHDAAYRNEVESFWLPSSAEGHHDVPSSAVPSSDKRRIDFPGSLTVTVPGAGAGADEDAALGAPSGYHRQWSSDSPTTGLADASKHLFVMTESGKPLYARHGDPGSLAHVLSACVALQSFSEVALGERIDRITAGEWRAVLRRKGPLVIWCLMRGEPDWVIDRCVDLAAGLLELVLTSRTLAYMKKVRTRQSRRFRHGCPPRTIPLRLCGAAWTDALPPRTQVPTFDVSPMLSGVASLLDGAVDSLSVDLPLALSSTPALPLPAHVRLAGTALLKDALIRADPSRRVLSAALMAGPALVACWDGWGGGRVERRDLALLRTWVLGSPGLRRAQSLVPVSLPHSPKLPDVVQCYVHFLDPSPAIDVWMRESSSARPQPGPGKRRVALRREASHSSADDGAADERSRVRRGDCHPRAWRPSCLSPLPGPLLLVAQCSLSRLLRTSPLAQRHPRGSGPASTSARLAWSLASFRVFPWMVSWEVSLLRE